MCPVESEVDVVCSSLLSDIRRVDSFLVESARKLYQERVPEAGELRLAVYDLLGREVEVLMDGHRDPGRFSVTWDARNRASGMYICRGIVGRSSQSVPMILLR